MSRLIDPNHYGYGKKPAHATKIIIQISDKRITLEGPDIEYRVFTAGNLLAIRFTQEGEYNNAAVIPKGREMTFSTSYIGMIVNKKR